MSNESLESLVLAKVNKIPLEDATTIDYLYEIYEQKQLSKKRKNPIIQDNPIQVEMEIEIEMVTSDEESISGKFSKKMKLSNSKD